VVGLILLAMAFDVVVGAAGRINGDAPLPRIGPLALGVLVMTLAVNVAIALYEARRGRELGSPFLLADAAHTRSDVFVTLGVLASVAAVKAGYPEFDVVAAIGVAGFIGWAGVSVLRSNLGYLVDRAVLSPALIERAVLGVPGVAGTHKIRSRGAPGSVAVDLHIQIAPHLDVVHAHRVTHWVIDAIRAQVDGVTDVVVHTEPARPDQPYPPLPWEDSGSR
jgi:cation diffusion facilitator family transporter